MELLIESSSCHVTWKVKDFFQLPSEIGYTLNSPKFHFDDDSYCLQLKPHAYDTCNNKTFVGVKLLRLTSATKRNVAFKLGRRSGREGSELDTYQCSSAFFQEYRIARSVLEKKRDIVVPDGTLTLLCSMRLGEQSSVGSLQANEAKRSNRKENYDGLPAESISRKFTTCAVQTEDANSVNGKENPKDEDWSSLDIKDDTLLRERMKELLTKGMEHDVTICVQDKEFRTHRSILSSRSPVFAMMLTHDSKEKNTGKIKIEDCDPESFDEFLLYVYSGRTENLTPTNALQLYYPADKYDFPVLKERCVKILKTSLSVESICDVVLLAAKHLEKELLEVATEFFARNMEEILVTVNWQKFLSQNLVVANELLIKSVDIIKNSEK